jgi:hypothetical protein
MAKTSSIIRDRLQTHASELIKSIILTLHDTVENAQIDNEISSRCNKILSTLERYFISSPETVILFREMVEAIVDRYVGLMKKKHWVPNERHWFSVAHKFLELNADVVAREDQLTASEVLNRTSVQEDDE